MSVKDQTLYSIGSYAMEMFREELTRLDKNASGALSRGFAATISNTLFGVQIDIDAEHYAHYVNAGRKAGLKGVPISALIPWVGVRNIPLNGKSARSVAFAVQAKIKRDGIKPAPFIDNTINRINNNKTLDNLVVKYYDQTINEAFDSIF